MAIYFCNEDPIDLNAVRLMGASVKTGTNPIGFFGTGLKYGLATFLRLGGKVTLKVRHGPTVQDSFHTFTTKKSAIRGTDFDEVCVDGAGLGFTTLLGRTWEGWQAYREFACNTMDECGVITEDPKEALMKPWGTVFSVEGEAVDKAHAQRSQIFVTGKPLAKTTYVEVHERRGPHAFYRGVRAKDLSHTPPLYAYNITAPLDLTEDRTIKHDFMLKMYVSEMVPRLTNDDLIRKILLAPQFSLEHSLDMSGFDEDPTPEFMAAVADLGASMECNKSARKLWAKHSGITDYVGAVTDEHEEKEIAAALALLAKFKVNLSRTDFTVVETLGPGIKGRFENGKIYLSRETLDLGPRYIASTLYEEHIHKTTGLKDTTRELQNFLLDKLFALVERLPEPQQEDKDASFRASLLRHRTQATDEIPF